MSAQPVDDVMSEPTFTLSWRHDGVEHVVVLDDLDDDAFDALPEEVRRWRPAQTYAAVEDIRWMAEHGERLPGVAARLSALRGRDVTIEAVERFLYRYGAKDVLQMLTRSQEDPAPVHSKSWRNRIHGRRLSGAALDSSRREWSRGPQELDPVTAPVTTTTPGACPRPAPHPFVQIARGGTVTGRRL